jgi:predicted tellurium resistance membrane protein TerC
MTHKLKYFAITLLLLITLSLVFERQAHAYVNPGSGLLIFQGISAVVSGALIYFRRRIKGLFTKSRPTTAPSAIQPPAVTDHR